ncbi:hypothetical protein SAMN03080615_02352 [Amphritea atlantica]|uniref:Ferritin-like domain-containing protein n=1 Tax=Amphritea atlantica TaxID=355243 RepID=A0A1H9I0V3_9GAMM|nr:hypothetical protein [Amphritea atlantica]SEQ68168.1 hypothetical protein SAMN03080615_02352 [Amphritea atlantica]
MSADSAPFVQDCCDPPVLYGWLRLQAQWVNAIKRAALRQLHASHAGERLLLRIYLIGEDATEIALQQELLSEPPDWIVRQMEQHLNEERQHVRAFAAALEERGETTVAQSTAQPDWLSRRKIAQWHAIAHRYESSFKSRLLVPAFAIGLCAEQMATRVLERHIRLLQQISPSHPLLPLLVRVLSDEGRHVQMCSGALIRLVEPHEQGTLQKMLAEIRAVDRSWSVTGALGLLSVGLLLRLLPDRS